MPRILVADADPGSREQLREELRASGYKSMPASDGHEVHAALESGQFDLVLAELGTPGIDRDAVQGWLQEFRETEIVVCASPEHTAVARGCVRDGAFDYIARPSANGDLVTTLERALERRQLRAESALHESSRVILATREPDRLPEVIVRVAIKAMHADDVALMVPGDDGRLHLACSNANSDIARRTVGELEANIAANTPREPTILSSGSVRSSIVYPLFAGERTAGVLVISRVTNRRAFAEIDLDKASVLASQIALALENMRLVRQTISADRMATVGQVATSIAHEVNNPLAYLLASQTHLQEQLPYLISLCTMLDSGATLEEVRARYQRAGGRRYVTDLVQALEDIRDGAERVRDILRDTRNIGATHDAAEEFDIGAAIRSALRLSAAELRHKTVVSTQLASDLFVRGPIGRFSQVFVNLLVNAAEQFEPNPYNAIAISGRVTQGKVTVTLRDNGPGVAADQLPRLFDPFFTTNLAIARDIVRAHGGDLTVESALGSGTAFTIVMPHASAPRGRVDTLLPIQRNVARLRVLCVDDEPNILKAYKRALARSHEVIVASDGNEALAAIRTHDHFDLIVCDLSMPGMSGMQLFDHVRQHNPQLADRFVFATGGATQKHVEQFIASVPNRVLEKPFEMRVLRDLVAELQLGA